MNEAEISKALSDLCAALPSSKTEAHLSISSGAHIERLVLVSVYPNGIVGSGGLYFRAATSAEALENARASIVEQVAAEVTKLVRKMALSIVEFTADEGECTDLMLREAGFSQSEITSHHKAACDRANAMTSEPREYAVIFA